jgi:hypothetical protein
VWEGWRGEGIEEYRRQTSERGCEEKKKDAGHRDVT